MSKRVMAFMAHPDDAEFTCAGTLARLKREADCRIVIATATSGDCGAPDRRPEEIARIRHEEAKAAAGVLDARYYAGGAIDLFILHDAPTLRRFVEIVRKARPDIVITHPPADYMIDHEMVSLLVRTACFSAPAPNMLTYDENPSPPLKAVPHLYYVDPLELKDMFGEPVAPDFVVDITAVLAIKEEMLACHASQREWLRAHHGVDEYLELMKRTAAERGQLIGRPAGEGFRQHRGHPHPQNNLIAELLNMNQ